MAHLMTSVAEYAIIFNEKKEFLLVQWGEEYDFKWHFPGGRMDEGEKEIDCLKREFKEELDVEIEDIHPVYSKYVTSEDCKWVKKPRYAVFYTAKLKPGSNIKLNTDELHAYKWFKITDIPKIDFWMGFYREMLENLLDCSETRDI